MASHRATAFVLLNPRARGGEAVRLWPAVRDRLAAKFELRVAEAGPPEGNLAAVTAAVAGGVEIYLAAGGDGTVNALVNALVEGKRARSLQGLVLGAVGLGSSNDFHKPYRAAEGPVPVRLDRAGARPHDVGVATFSLPGGPAVQRCFLVSASLGLTAEGNAFFNEGDAAVRWLKRRWSAGAILYAALWAIARHRNVVARVAVDGQTRRAPITNLCVLKTPHLAGTFRFEAPVRHDDGLFAVALCEGMGRAGALRALIDLARGQFSGKPHRYQWRASRIDVELDEVGTLELDGEVTRASHVGFGMLPERIAICA